QRALRGEALQRRGDRLLAGEDRLAAEHVAGGLLHSREHAAGERAHAAVRKHVGGGLAAPDAGAEVAVLEADDGLPLLVGEGAAGGERVAAVEAELRPQARNVLFGQGGALRLAATELRELRLGRGRGSESRSAQRQPEGERGDAAVTSHGAPP